MYYYLASLLTRALHIWKIQKPSKTTKARHQHRRKKKLTPKWHSLAIASRDGTVAFMLRKKWERLVQYGKQKKPRTWLPDERAWVCFGLVRLWPQKLICFFGPAWNCWKNYTDRNISGDNNTNASAAAAPAEPVPEAEGWVSSYWPAKGEKLRGSWCIEKKAPLSNTNCFMQERKKGCWPGKWPKESPRHHVWSDSCEIRSNMSIGQDRAVAEEKKAVCSLLFLP